MHKAALVFTSSLLAWALAGCQPDSRERLCTLIGGDSGVAITFDDVREAHPSIRFTVEACVNDQCETAKFSQSQTAVIRVLDESMDATPVDVTLTITGEGVGPVFNGTTTVTPQKRQPNGPDCEPTVFNASVQAAGNEELTVTDLD